METIVKQISLEPYITRFPVCWPSLKDGEVVYVNPYEINNNPLVNYGKIPLGINENVIHQSYSVFTTEMWNAYSGETLSYNTLQEWFTMMLSYRRVLSDNECHGKFESMKDYYENNYIKGGDLTYAQEQDELYMLHGGDAFYKWLINNYFILLDLEDAYDEEENPEITEAFSYPEWKEIILNCGGPLITFPSAVILLAKMSAFYEKFEGKECGDEEECCDCVDYYACGGKVMYELLFDWVEQIQLNIDANNVDVDILAEDEKRVLYPTIDIRTLLKVKMEDFGIFESIATDFKPGHDYQKGNICIADDDVWIFDTDDEVYNEMYFDSSRWSRYYDYYKNQTVYNEETHQYEKVHENEFIEMSDMPDMSGRTVSSLDSFLRVEETVDGMGNTLPGYFRPISSSTFIQPGENDTLGLMYSPGTYINAKVIIDNGRAKTTGSLEGNVYEGDVLFEIRFFCKDWNGNELSVTSISNFEGQDTMNAINRCIAHANTLNEEGVTPTDGNIYADFIYYKGCTFIIDSYDRVVPSGETYVRCVDHCRLEESSCQYHLSQTEAYPLKYYNVIKDVETVYSVESECNVDVCMCDFSFKPSQFNPASVVITPIFRKEELLGFSRSETPMDNIYIDRGYATVLDRHLRIGEVRNYEQLEKYGNGIFQIFNSDEDVV